MKKSFFGNHVASGLHTHIHHQVASCLFNQEKNLVIIRMVANCCFYRRLLRCTSDRFSCVSSPIMLLFWLILYSFLYLISFDSSLISKSYVQLV